MVGDVVRDGVSGTPGVDYLLDQFGPKGGKSYPPVKVRRFIRRRSTSLPFFPPSEDDGGNQRRLHVGTWEGQGW